MKIIKTLALLLLSFSAYAGDLSNAREQARKENKYILLTFSGSDWCIPCIKTRKEIFEKDTFLHFQQNNLVIVNADFPRLKKNALSKEKTKENEAIAEEYNKNGVFPLTLLLDADGNVLKSWEGFPGVSPEVFINQIISIEQGKRN